MSRFAIDAIGTKAAPVTLTGAYVSGAAFDAIGFGQLTGFIFWTPQAATDTLSIKLQTLRPGGALATAADWCDFSTSAVAGGIDSRLVHEIAWLATGTVEQRIAFNLEIHAENLKLLAKDDAGGGGTLHVGLLLGNP